MRLGGIRYLEASENMTSYIKQVYNRLSLSFPDSCYKISNYHPRRPKGTLIRAVGVAAIPGSSTKKGSALKSFANLGSHQLYLRCQISTGLQVSPCLLPSTPESLEDTGEGSLGPRCAARWRREPELTRCLSWEPKSVWIRLRQGKRHDSRLSAKILSSPPPEFSNRNCASSQQNGWGAC